MRRWILTAIVVGLGVQIAFDAGFLRSTYPPELNDGRDLLAFVTAGRIFAGRDPGPQGVYDLEVQRQEQEALTGLEIPPGTGLPFMHPPHLVPVQGLLSSFDYSRFWLMWAGLMLAGFLTSFIVLDRGFSRAGVPAITRVLVALTGLAFAPVVISLVHGQDTALLYLGVAGWITGFAMRRDLLAGLALSLATIRPHVAIVLALPFLFARRRVLMGFVIGSAAWLGWFLVSVGAEGVAGFATAILSVAGLSEFGVDPSPMVNLAGLLRRILPESGLGAARFAAWITWLATIAFFCHRWTVRRAIGGPFPADLGPAIVLSLVFSPHLNFSDLALLHAAAAPLLLQFPSRPDARLERVPDTGASPGEIAVTSLLFVSLCISAATLGTSPVSELLLISAYVIAFALVAWAARPRSLPEQVPVRSDPGARK